LNSYIKKLQRSKLSSPPSLFFLLFPFFSFLSALAIKLTLWSPGFLRERSRTLFHTFYLVNKSMPRLLQLLTVLMDDVDDFLRNHYCPAELAAPESMHVDAPDGDGGHSHHSNASPAEQHETERAQPSGEASPAGPETDRVADAPGPLLDLYLNLTRSFSKPSAEPQRGCVGIVKVFLDHVTAREGQNFKTRREENQNSVTLTTMHQSKGLEWDNVFVVKVNDTETPLLHEEVHGRVEDGAASLEVRSLLCLNLVNDPV
jgi:hypothetical protein